MKRTPENLEWIRRLREDGLPQTRGVLEDRGGNCCIGLRANQDVAAGNMVKTIASTMDGTMAYRDLSSAYRPGDLAITHPGYATRSRWGVSDEEIRILVTANDSDRKTFPEIADIIEALLDPEESSSEE